MSVPLYRSSFSFISMDTLLSEGVSKMVELLSLSDERAGNIFPVRKEWANNMFVSLVDGSSYSCFKVLSEYLFHFLFQLFLHLIWLPSQVPY